VKIPVFAAIALTVGATASFMAARWMGGGQTSGPKVVIVEQPIMAGKAITAEQVKAVAWPASDVPQGSFNRATSVTGRVAREAMFPGEPVLPRKLAPKGAKGGLSSVIPAGKRAITVKVNEVVAVAGFALPGSYVDILVNGKDTNKQNFTRTVLSRVKVLAVDQVTTGDPNKPKVVNAVTLELTPHETEKLDLARNVGKLSLVLRNELDTLKIESKGVRMPEIVYPQFARSVSKESEEQAAPPPQDIKPEEIRGTNRQSVAKP
jgi:pilus assembly protein CpaB